MNRRSFLAAISLVVVVLSAAACRQPDGPMPPTMTDTTNRIGDMSRDLLSIANGDPSAEQDFVDDLGAFAANAESAAATQRAARRLAETVRGVKLSEQAAQQLAQTCWVAIAGRQLSERQVEDLIADFRTQLAALGVQEGAIQATLTEVTAAQGAVNERPRRWYEF